MTSIFPYIWFMELYPGADIGGGGGGGGGADAPS